MAKMLVTLALLSTSSNKVESVFICFNTCFDQSFILPLKYLTKMCSTIEPLSIWQPDRGLAPPELHRHPFDTLINPCCYLPSDDSKQPQCVCHHLLLCNALNLDMDEMETIKPYLFANLIILERLTLRVKTSVSLPEGLLSRNTQLKEFQIQETEIPVHLPSGFLANLTKLWLVRLSGCKITSLPEDIFSGSKNINQMHLNKNLLTTLPAKIFIDLDDLEYLDLSQNQIISLPEGLFMRTTKLKTLNMWHNRMTQIPSHLFPTKHKFLDLSLKKMRDIHGERLNNLEALMTLNNTLMKIYTDRRVFKDNLRTLNLTYNNLQYVTFRDLADFDSDVMIDLSYNNISFVDFWGAAEFGHISNLNPSIKGDVIRCKVKLYNNPFNCDCNLLPFVQFLQNDLSPAVLEYIQKNVHNYFKIPPNNLKCHEPIKLEKMPLHEVNQNLLTCEVKSVSKGSYNCPENCTCHYRPLDRANVINCENLGLQTIPSSLPLFVQANHSELNLEGNQLRRFILPEGRGYENLTHLYLSHNNITEFSISGVSSNIKVLDLSYNNLTRLSSKTISKLEAASMTSLDFYNNPWSCDCIAKPLIRLIKNGYKQVSRRHNVTCSNGDSIVNVEESKLCPEIAVFLVIICIFCAILGYALAILTTLYYQYRTEIHVYCYSSDWKVLQWLVSQPDYDDTKKYDAFISFANDDVKFVTEKIVPFLEDGEKKFKLCLHYRDFVPGDPIPDQILKSVKNSQRTIVVLSPNYLNSVWGIAEFKTAHAEAMKNGSSKVIVILYQDVEISQIADEDLKAYLKMNTYLKWESQWFWRQLIYALPHPPENAEDLKCAFGCFQRNSKSSRNHEVLRNVRLKNGEVHYSR